MNRYGAFNPRVRNFLSNAGFSAILCILLMFLADSALSQNRTLGEIQGTVSDPTGAIVRA
jgi:hypothetical protein